VGHGPSREEHPPRARPSKPKSHESAVRPTRWPPPTAPPPRTKLCGPDGTITMLRPLAPTTENQSDADHVRYARKVLFLAFLPSGIAARGGARAINLLRRESYRAVPVVWV